MGQGGDVIGPGDVDGEELGGELSPLPLPPFPPTQEDNTAVERITLAKIAFLNLLLISKPPL
jgi:hypothetical protein